MPQWAAFENELAAAWPPSFWQDVTVLVAVSGGADSVALLRALAAVRPGGPGRLIAAHVNHQLRGTESDADEAFVRDLCHRLGLPCEVERLTLAADRQRAAAGLEERARRARYAALTQLAHRLGARYVATGHTADDQAETILHRLLRGTGLAGLAGMARARPLSPATSLVRPLLGVRRAAVLEYLQTLGQPYRHDSSNADLQFTRNRLRHQLLPELAAAVNPGVVEALLRLGGLAGEVQEVIGGLVGPLLAACRMDSTAEGVSLTLAPLASQPRYLVRETLMSAWRQQGWPLQAMGFAQWDQLADMALGGRAEPEKRVFPGGVVAERRGDTLRLTRGRAAM